MVRLILMTKYMINMSVPLDDNRQNANIKANILSDSEMRDLGFTDFSKDSWYFHREVGGENSNISFNITIFKRTGNIRIGVFNELFLQPYDFQMYIGSNDVANKVYDDVQSYMKYFMDKGVISGYTLGDYI